MELLGWCVEFSCWQPCASWATPNPSPKKWTSRALPGHLIQQVKDQIFHILKIWDFFLISVGFSWILVCPKVLTLKECCLKLDYCNGFEFVLGIAADIWHDVWYRIACCTMSYYLFWTRWWFQFVLYFFYPDPWRNDPIWRAYFSNWLEKKQL